MGRLPPSTTEQRAWQHTAERQRPTGSKQRYCEPYTLTITRTHTHTHSQPLTSLALAFSLACSGSSCRARLCVEGRNTMSHGAAPPLPLEEPEGRYVPKPHPKKAHVIRPDPSLHRQCINEVLQLFETVASALRTRAPRPHRTTRTPEGDLSMTTKGCVFKKSTPFFF